MCVRMYGAAGSVLIPLLSCPAKARHINHQSLREGRVYRIKKRPGPGRAGGDGTGRCHACLKNRWSPSRLPQPQQGLTRALNNSGHAHG